MTDQHKGLTKFADVNAQFQGYVLQNEFGLSNRNPPASRQASPLLVAPQPLQWQCRPPRPLAGLGPDFGHRGVAS